MAWFCIVLHCFHCLHCFIVCIVLHCFHCFLRDIRLISEILIFIDFYRKESMCNCHGIRKSYNKSLDGKEYRVGVGVGRGQARIVIRASALLYLE